MHACKYIHVSAYLVFIQISVVCAYFITMFTLQTTFSDDGGLINAAPVGVIVSHIHMVVHIIPRVRGNGHIWQHLWLQNSFKLVNNNSSRI